MKLLGRPTVLVLCVLLLSIASAAQSEWQGTYQFDENGGKNAGGTVIFVTHEISVIDTDGGLAATVKSNGYQTSRDLNCTVKIVGPKMLLYFESYGDDNIFESYVKGDLLLTLERKAAEGETSIVTHWGKFMPVIPKNEKSGKIYFTKSETTRL